MVKKTLILCAAVGLASGLSINSLMASQKSVTFVSPKDGATVTSPFKTQFNQTGMTITPAGQEVNDKTKGHFHVIIDKPAVAEGQIIPVDPAHLHFGKGQTESGEIKLPPGKHTLTLQFADGLHRAYGPDLTKTITITVK